MHLESARIAQIAALRSTVPLCLLVLVLVLLLAVGIPTPSNNNTNKHNGTQDKSRKRPRTEMGLVKETQARWKDHPDVPGDFFVEGDIPSLEGSNSRKVVQKQPISPRGRGAVVPGPPPSNFARISE